MPEQQHSRYQNEQRRIDASRASRVKVPEGEFSLPQMLDDESGDEIARDDKENVDAHETSWNAGDSEMKQHDCDNGDGTQSIDIRPVMH